MNADTYSNPKSNASWMVDDLIARYRSVRQRRIALRRALVGRPDDPRLRQMIGQLAQPSHIHEAAADGIFLSYARQDELFAFELAEELRESRINVWLDILDVQGSDWHSEVSAALERCGLMLAVMSPDAVTSAAMTQEREHFEQSGKLIVPVVYRYCDLSAIDFWLPPVDFTHRFELGMIRLQRVLGATTAV
jgi:hypothetical protein